MVKKKTCNHAAAKSKKKETYVKVSFHWLFKKLEKKLFRECEEDVQETVVQQMEIRTFPKSAPRPSGKEHIEIFRNREEP